jgi:hypothetical protein
MSRQYNPAVVAYKRMDLEGFNRLEGMSEKKTGGGLLTRSSMPMSNNGDDKKLDYKNPAVRVAKQMQIIRKYRDEINGNAV